MDDFEFGLGADAGKDVHLPDGAQPLLQRRVGATMQVLVDHAPALGRRGGRGRSYADAPEIDGVVHLLPPAKASLTLKAGEFVRAQIVDTRGHDLVAQPL